MRTARRMFLLVGLSVVAAACSSRPPAPVVDRSTPPRAEVPVDGLYRVRRGDSLYAIAFRYGLDYRDIAAWNSIRAPYVIFPDQVLRLKAPVNAAEAPARRTVQTAPAPPPREAESRPVPPPATDREPSTRPEPEGPDPETSAPSSAVAPATVPAADPDSWLWPVEGRVLRTYKAGDPARNGIDITASEGQPVRATAAGQVVYSGNGLIGYGELVIVKHSDRMLSAYAHNRRRLVAEGERVERGQPIAELGRNDRNEPLLHFEIRVDGTPVDPQRYLPRR